MIPTIFYCYDAYCGWCFGFSPVIRQLANEYQHKLAFETLSGGMIPKESAQHIGKIAEYIQGAYHTVEKTTGIQFGEDYLWHIKNPDKSDWFPHSDKAATALIIFKELFPDKSVEFAAELQKALHYEGRDLTDDEAYRHLLDKYDIHATEFYEKLNSEQYHEKTIYEYTLVKQLQVNGFPAVLLQTDELKFFLLTRGYTNYETLKERIDRILQDLENKTQYP
jgi:putative protein-disulfide isomerase